MGRGSMGLTLRWQGIQPLKRQDDRAPSNPRVVKVLRIGGASFALKQSGCAGGKTATARTFAAWGIQGAREKRSRGGD